MPSSSEQSAEDLKIDGGTLQTADDVARVFAVPAGNLIHALYKAPDQSRYSHFEIPKRSGGMRLISTPRGLVRELQSRLNPVLQSLYRPHPSAHGFIPERSAVSNAKPHAGRRFVLNVDLEDFFPSINFGRVRGLFMAEPFGMGPAAATVLAQLCTHRNGLPQGAPTSPVLSNFIAATLDRRLQRLAREHRLDYSRYADDITLSGDQHPFPTPVAVIEQTPGVGTQVTIGEALEHAIGASGFKINPRKVRFQGRAVRQSVTGITVNERANVERTRVRRVRAMLHAWEKFGLAGAGGEHFDKYHGKPRAGRPEDPGPRFRGIVYGELAYIKMVRGADDPVFLKLAARLVGLDPNPSRFIREMAFGAADYDIFISHASEDKAAIARPIFEACERLGLKAFLDEEHIAWGESFTTKINTALGAARTVLAIVSSTSVGKEWPVREVNAALALEVTGEKRVVPLIVGKPDLSRLPLIKTKNFMEWTGDAAIVAERLRREARGEPRATEPMPVSTPAPAAGTGLPEPTRRRLLDFFRRK